MKFKTTKKAIMNGYPRVLSVGYCDLQFLLYYKSPIAYTSGVNGWGADIYQITDSFAIATGYSPFGNIKSDYEFNKRIETQAEKIVHDYKTPFEERQKMLDYLLEKLFQEYTKKGGAKK